MLVYALVPSTDEFSESLEEMALATAKHVFDKLVGVGVDYSPVFDYYTTFDDHTSRGSGPARYGEKSYAVPIDDPEGARMLHNGWKYTKAQFERDIEKVREALDKYSNEQIREDIDADMAQYYMRSLSEYEGPSIRLYTQHGEGVRTRRHLDQILDESENLWIVPADVHF